jgi:hypothetical protein
MNQHLCQQCGAENAADAQFCVKCDFYLGWDARGESLDGAPLTSDVPVVRETHTQSAAVSLSPKRPHRAAPSSTIDRKPATRPAVAPQVTIGDPEVELDPHGGGTVDVRIRNTSSIVDGYTVMALNAPKWLEIQHPEIRLLTDEESDTTVTFSVRPGFDIYVQRFRLPIRICSVEDPSKRTDAEIIVVVPRIGGPITIVAEPQVVRLRDQTSGRFRLRLDNTGSNYPQRYALSGSDPERVVRVGFRPRTVEVPPRRVVYVDVCFDAPALDYGQQAPRALNITAASDQGPVDTVVNVVQERSQAPSDSPVRLRLEPSITRIRDKTSAEISLHVDNRRGSKDRRLVFTGRDPEGRVRFAFSQQQLHIRAGDQARVRARIEAPLPHPGEDVERAFAVVCNDGADESEATGSLVQAASPSAITTAKIQLEPEHVVVRNRRRGRFRVTVDNSGGTLPLSVWLSGSDPEGAVRFRFKPPCLAVPPGSIGRASLNIAANLPGGGQEIAREIKVKADDGVGMVEAEGRFTQSMSEILPLLRLVLTFVGGLLVVLGAIRPWFLGGPSYDIGRLLELQNVVQFKALGELENIQKLEAITQPAARAFMLMLAGVMMLGILSSRGKFTVVAGFLAGMLMIGYTAYAVSEFHSSGPAYGALLIMLGAVMGVIGGFCIKRGGGTS